MYFYIYICIICTPHLEAGDDAIMIKNEHEIIYVCIGREKNVRVFRMNSRTSVEVIWILSCNSQRNRITICSGRRR